MQLEKAHLEAKICVPIFGPWKHAERHRFEPPKLLRLEDAKRPFDVPVLTDVSVRFTCRPNAKHLDWVEFWMWVQLGCKAPMMWCPKCGQDPQPRLGFMDRYTESESFQV